MTDTEIYIDGHATSTFRTLYESLEEQRQIIVQKYKQADKGFLFKDHPCRRGKGRRFLLPCDAQNMGRHSPRHTESP